MAKTNAAGLDGVIAAETRVSDVDGERGRLVLAGHDVEQFAGSRSLEEVAALLWTGVLPNAAGEKQMQARLARGRANAFEALPRLGDALTAADGMDALRAALGHLRPSADLDADLAGAVAVFVAGALRTGVGKRPLAPDATLDHATDFLRMALGDRPTPAKAKALTAYLVTVSDHSMNASTFAARVVASTGSDAVSAVVAGVGALKGPLHGGAPGPVLDMLDAVGTPDRARSWIEAELTAGRRIMGMGHRIYRVRDPRAAVLEREVEKLEQAGSTERLALARAVEKTAEEVLQQRHPDRPLSANVEFYTAVLLEAVGLPRQAFTPTFAVGRVFGWLAHIQEQLTTGRLLRPAARYVGPPAPPPEVT